MSDNTSSRGMMVDTQPDKDLLCPYQKVLPPSKLLLFICRCRRFSRCCPRRRRGGMTVWSTQFLERIHVSEDGLPA